MFQKLKGILLISILFSTVVYSQNYTNSPYSRFGIGDIINSGFAYNRSLGGTSIAIRPKNQINYLNPASYTSQDTLSFLFQAGFTGRITDVSTGIDSDRSTNANIEFLAMAFPITRWMKVSVGLVPYSRIQYLFEQRINTRQVVDGEIDPDQVTIFHRGQGGFNDFYVGTAFQIENVVSLGVNFGYLFGSLDRTKSSLLAQQTNTTARFESTENYIANDFYYKFGAQYYPTILDDHHLTLGFTFDSKSKIDVERQLESPWTFTAETPVSAYSDFLGDTSTSSYFTMPAKYAIGAAYSYKGMYGITTEYITQNWEKSNLSQGNNSLVKYNSYRMGININPAPLTVKTRESYLKRMHYRVGGHFTQTYLNLGGTQINDYGLSLGLGLPWKDSRNLYTNTSFNISYEFGVRGTSENNLIKENYHIITVGFTLYDFWFMKSKYD